MYTCIFLFFFFSLSGEKVVASGDSYMRWVPPAGLPDLIYVPGAFISFLSRLSLSGKKKRYTQARGFSYKYKKRQLAGRKKTLVGHRCGWPRRNQWPITVGVAYTHTHTHSRRAHADIITHTHERKGVECTYALLSF